MQDLTITIKTFEREKSLIRLLSSIRVFYKNVPIIIVDDSKHNYKESILHKFSDLNITYIITEFDIGLSKGRNILVQNVTTKYFLLCDDDFEFDKRTDLETALKIYSTNKYDILGGNVYNLFELNNLYSFLWAMKHPTRFKKIKNKEEIISIYNGIFKEKKGHVELNINSRFQDFIEKDVYDVQICSNFFIGNTKTILKLGGWIPENVKVGEHQLFFYRAWKQGLKIGYSKKIGVKHYPEKRLLYNRYRLRSTKMFIKGLKYLKLASYKTIVNGKIVFKYIRGE